MSRTLKNRLKRVRHNVRVISQQRRNFHVYPSAVFAADSVLFVDFPRVTITAVASAPPETGRLVGVAVVMDFFYAENVTVDIQKLYELVPGIRFGAKVKRPPGAMYRLRRVRHARTFDKTISKYA